MERVSSVARDASAVSLWQKFVRAWAPLALPLFPPGYSGLLSAHTPFTRPTPH